MKKIDPAVKKDEQQKSAKKLKAIRHAVRDWVRWKGTRWQNSKRNKRPGDNPPKYMVEKLKVTVETGWGPPLTKEEINALKELEKGRKLTLQRLFTEKKLCIKKKRAANEVRKGVTQLSTAKDGITQLRDMPASQTQSNAEHSQARVIVEKMLGDLLDGETLTAILPDLTETFVGEMVSSMVPFVAQIKSGGAAVVAIGTAAKAKYTEIGARAHGYAIETGDPEAAFASLQKCLERDVKQKAIGATIQTADFGTRLGTTFVDGGLLSGPVTGAVTAFAKLAQQIFQVGRDYKEAQQANALLADHNNLDMRLFKTAPVLGCYMLLCSSTSDILNLSSVGFARTWDWKSEAEEIIRKHIWPTQELAAELIKDARWEIPDLASRASVDSRLFGALRYA